MAEERVCNNGRESPDLFEFSAPLSYTEEDRTEEWVGVDGYGDCISTTAREGKRDEPGCAPSEVSAEPSPAAPISRIGLNDNKAGMEGLDKAKINQIIIEASKGSKYYENELKKEEQVTRRVDRILTELRSITPAQKAAALRAADKELESLEATRELNRIIVHVDMDAFYASVEIRDDPRLKDVPMAVGSTAMLNTSNYLARRYGIRAAMPGFIAKKLCPHLVIVPSHFAKYRAASGLVRGVLANYDPQFSPVGLDESYLDLTEFVKLQLEQQQKEEVSKSSKSHSGSSDVKLGISVAEELATGSSLTPLHWRCAETVVERMRREIRERTGLTASAGLAPNMMLAKIASDMNKPNGQYTVTTTREGVVNFVQKLPIRKISGIGKVTERMLNALEVTTCGDLYQQRAVLRLLFSPTSATHFLRVSIGLGSTHVHREYDRKSMSNERTFTELSSVSDLQHKCRELCEGLAHDMEHHLIKGRTVALKVKTVHFEVKTRAVTLPQPVSSEDQLYGAASELLTAEIRACAPNPLRLRLMGVRISSLVQRGEGAEGGGGGPRGKQETLDVFVHPLSTNTTRDDWPAEQICPNDEAEHTVRCPVCGETLDDTQDSSINSHIDECLNRPTITSITTAVETKSPEKFKASPAAKAIVSPHKARGTAGKRRKKKTASSRKRQSELRQDNKSENVGPESTKRRKTLHHFWN